MSLPKDKIKDLHPNRWEEGRPHHPKSVEIMDALEHVDFTIYGDYFRWKRGGDGYNGETLQFELDIYFESVDREAPKTDPGRDALALLLLYAELRHAPREQFDHDEYEGPSP